MSTPDNIEKYILLHDGKIVNKAFYDMIIERIADVLPAVIPSVSYTAEDLCGEEFWRTLDDGHRRRAGKCMVHMVKTGKLPLQIQGCEHQYPRKYMLR